MADNKVTEAFRGQVGTVKRSLFRQRSLHDVGEGNPAIVREPQATPSQLVGANECWENLNRGQSPLVRQVLMMRKEGHSYEEIACVTGLHVKTLQRYLKRLMKGVAQ